MSSCYSLLEACSACVASVVCHAVWCNRVPVSELRISLTRSTMAAMKATTAMMAMKKAMKSKAADALAPAMENEEVSAGHFQKLNAGG